MEGKDESMTDSHIEKTDGEQLSEKLSFSLKSCWEKASEAEKTEIYAFSEKYKSFLDKSRTPQLFINNCTSDFINYGFIDFESFCKNKNIIPGTGIYQTLKGKSIFFVIPGKQPISSGVNIICSHIDSPHIGLKSNPLYENSDLAFFDTHYYGGIKYYQWAAIPLIMAGTIIDKDGIKKQIQLGSNDNEPVFTITDLLPHLAEDQMKKNAAEFIDAEGLDILIGSEPYQDKKITDKVKINILNILYNKYGIDEKSFTHIDISFVPAFNARDVGFDHSMIGAHGHDDKCCAFALLQAALKFTSHIVNKTSPPEKAIIGIFVDNEEVGGYRPYLQHFKYFLQAFCPALH